MADLTPVTTAIQRYGDIRYAEGKAAATPPPVDPPPPVTPPSAWLAKAKAIPGLTHAYPLDAAAVCKDVVGTAHGVAKGSGTTLGATGATFTGKGYIELPDTDDFSVATTGQLTIVCTVTILDWRGAGASEYVHWMGKGVSGAHEYVFRHYCQGGSGEAGSRQGRVSGYCFSAAGGLGAGSYFQDPMTTTPFQWAWTCDMRAIHLYRDGLHRDTDLLSGYSIVPRNTSTPVRLGTRDMSTGFLIGRLANVAFFSRVLSQAQIASLR